MLRSYCGQQSQKWLKFLPLVEFAYNSSLHKSLQMSPFKTLYGQECLTSLCLANPNLSVLAIKETLGKLDCQLQIIRENLKKANRKQRSYADLKHLVQEYKRGDQVFIKVKPKKSFLRLGKNKKLDYRYC